MLEVQAAILRRKFKSRECRHKKEKTILFAEKQTKITAISCKDDIMYSCNHAIVGATPGLKRKKSFKSFMPMIDFSISPKVLC